MELSLDTKSKLGVITSRRAFVIDDLSWDKLLVGYSAASGPQAAEIERQLTTEYKRRLVMPGQIVAAKSASASSASGKIAWYPDKTGLRVKAQVTDAHFASFTPETALNGFSYVLIQTSCPGSAGDIHWCEVVPGSDGKAKVFGKKDVNATWKRTTAGYDIDVRIPWNRVAGYQPSMKLLPVQVNVMSSKARNISELASTGNPNDIGARAFVVLKLRK